ncbi:MAG: hypothetical protein KGI38_12700 [Thaumarchaeota archaeon]|nr:hypothetical protein [Nitrososphaerota archaeon]
MGFAKSVPPTLAVYIMVFASLAIGITLIMSDIYFDYAEERTRRIVRDEMRKA